jgi:1,4-alpha-glucan branching enzyme
MLRKTFSENGCHVEFSLPSAFACDACEVFLIGDFNKWDRNISPMRKKGDTFRIELDLEEGKEYEYLYCVDGRTENDWNADMHIPSPYGGDNSVVVTYRLD